MAEPLGGYGFDDIEKMARAALSGESGEPKPFRCPHVPSCCPLDPDSAPYTEVGESGEPKEPTEP